MSTRGIVLWVSFLCDIVNSLECFPVLHEYLKRGLDECCGDKVLFFDGVEAVTVREVIDGVNEIKGFLLKAGAMATHHAIGFKAESLCRFMSVYIAAMQNSFILEPIRSCGHKIHGGIEGIDIELRELVNGERSVGGGIYIRTSGSTGEPKSILLGFERLINSAASIQEYMEIKPEDRPAWCMPYSYVYGLSMINVCLIAGCAFSTYNIGKDGLEETIANFIQNRINKLFGVPAAIGIFARYVEELPNRIEDIYIAGGRCCPDMGRLFIEHGIRLCIMYGCTEASARLSYLFVDEYKQLDEGCVGSAIRGVDLLILDENYPNDNTSDDIQRFQKKGGQVGHVYFRSEYSCVGIVSSEGCYKDTSTAAVLPSGDIGYMDGNMLYIVGRAGRFAKIGGFKVSLEELDENIRRHDKVLDCFSLVETRRTGSDVIHACVVMKKVDNMKSTKSIDLLSASCKRWAPYVEVRLVESIPLRPNGKYDQVALKTLIPHFRDAQA